MEKPSVDTLTVCVSELAAVPNAELTPKLRGAHELLGVGRVDDALRNAYQVGVYAARDMMKGYFAENEQS